MKRYRIHTSLQDFEGAKSGRVYTCTREAIYTAPQGEFKELGRQAYSLLGDAPSAEGPGEGADESEGEEEPADDGPATTDSSDNDDASSSSPTDSTA